MVHYPIPPHREETYRGGELVGDWPITDAIHAEVLSLSMGPCLTDAEAARVVAAVNAQVG